MIKEIFVHNKILFWLGGIHFILFSILLLYAPFNNTVVLGINSVLKPMKFALSIWVFSWTMALILHYVQDVRKVKTYSWAAVVALGFEQVAITAQALRGELSHFNKTTIYNSVLYSLMGIFILGITLWTAHIAYIFIKQKAHTLPPSIVLSIKIGLIYFVFFSLFGGYVSGLEGHTVGAADGGEGLWFLNWSKSFGDLRVAHFFGIHSLQIIPLFAICAEKYSMDSGFSVKAVWVFSLVYLNYVVVTLIQGLMGLPFMQF
jgi:hypothetical protein